MLKQVLFLKIYFDGFSFRLKVEIITIVQRIKCMQAQLNKSPL